MEKQFISRLQDKDVVQSIYVLRERSVHTGRNGRAYLSLVLGDSSGNVDGRAWDNVEELTAAFQPGDIVKVRGIVQMFQNRKQVVVHRLERADEKEINRDQLIAPLAVNVETLKSQLFDDIAAIKDPFVKQLLNLAMEHPDVKARFFSSPAAKTIHHAYRGGLLEHVVSICGMMKFIAEHYPFVNKDLLIFGAIFHDLGKIWELNAEVTTTYTDEGRLVGHLVMAVEFIDELALQIPDFPKELGLILKHIVLSHHGKLEYGSPKLPQILEAFIVAAIDDFDSKINTIFGFMQSEKNNGHKWTRFNPLLERYFYLGITADSAYPSPNQKNDVQIPIDPPMAERIPSLSIPDNVDGLTYKK